MRIKGVPAWPALLWLILGTAVMVNAATGTDLPRVKEVTGTLELNNVITVRVDNLADYLQYPDRDPKKFILYLDRKPIKGVTVRQDTDPNVLEFKIKKSEEARDSWQDLLGSPEGWTRKVTVSIGHGDERPLPSEVEYDLIVIKKKYFWIFIAVFTAVMILFIYLARRTAILREPSKLKETQKVPFSLGRTQMAFWFFIIAASYIFIWMVTGDLDSITESALALMGISAATALGANALDSTKHGLATTKYQELKIEQEELRTRLEVLAREISRASGTDKISLGDEHAAKQARLQQISGEISILERHQEPESKGFLRDLVSDVNGVSLHRFQIFVWTIVLGIIFVLTMYRSLAMPQFSATLLTLMGISGGTYIGFKFTEQKN